MYKNYVDLAKNLFYNIHNINFQKGSQMLDYSFLEDEKLVILSKENDAKAFSVLSERYFPKASYHAGKFCSCGIEKEDLTQEGMLGLISAVYAFSENGKASFSTFANHCIKNRIISAVRSVSSAKHIPVELTVPLDSESTLIDESSPEDSLISQTESERIYRLIKTALTEKEKKVFLHFLAGLSYEEIAQKEGCTAKSVDSTLQRVRKKLREQLS